MPAMFRPVHLILKKSIFAQTLLVLLKPSILVGASRSPAIKLQSDPGLVFRAIRHVRSCQNEIRPALHVLRSRVA